MNVYGEIARRLRRAARSGTRLHLEVEHARALMDVRFYALLTELEGEEIRREIVCAEEAVPLIQDPPREMAASESRRSTPEMPLMSAAVARAADRRVTAVADAIRQRRRGEKGKGKQGRS